MQKNEIPQDISMEMLRISKLASYGAEVYVEAIKEIYRLKAELKQEREEKEALKILADSRSHKLIAADYGITRPAVSALKRGDTWGHLHI